MEPVVFIPGFMNDARLFRSQAEPLACCRPVQISPVSGADSVRELAERALAAAPDRFALVGASLGGMVAIEMVRRAPDRVTRLALISTDALSEQPGIAAERDLMISRAKAGRLEDAMDEAVPTEALAPGPNRATVRDTMMAMARRAGPEAFQRQSRAMQRRPDQQGTLRRIHVPAMVICGWHDRIFPARRHQLMADLIPHAIPVGLEDAGHLPTLEQPDQVLAALEHWLSL